MYNNLDEMRMHAEITALKIHQETQVVNSILQQITDNNVVHKTVNTVDELICHVIPACNNTVNSVLLLDPIADLALRDKCVIPVIAHPHMGIRGKAILCYVTDTPTFNKRVYKPIQVYDIQACIDNWHAIPGKLYLNDHDGFIRRTAKRVCKNLERVFTKR